MDKRTTPDRKVVVETDARHEGDPVYSNDAAMAAEHDKYQIPGGPEGIGSLIGGIIKDLQELVRDEIQLAKLELSEDAGKIGKALGFVAGAALIGLVGFIFLMLALTYALAQVMDDWIAAGIVGLGLVIIAAILGVAAKNKLSAASLKPEQTIETLKEDKEWAQQQINSVKK
jgi:uncharacterized membrane protein YqjE